jgi:hypothetical protein
MQIGQAAVPGKIAEPVPLEAVDSARKDIYTPLIEARRAELSGAGIPVPEEPKLEPAEVDPAEPDQADKQAFLKAVLGDKSYEKVYSMFGGTLEATLADRATKRTESLFDELRKLSEKLKFHESDWALWEERFMLASTLTKLRFKGSAVKEYDRTDDLEGRIRELMEFSKPAYSALMETSRLFERHVNILTSKAHEEGFWPTGGSVSR